MSFANWISNASGEIKTQNVVKITYVNRRYKENFVFKMNLLEFFQIARELGVQKLGLILEIYKILTNYRVQIR